MVVLFRRAVPLIVLFAVVLVTLPALAQTSILSQQRFAKGQNVHPVFEGWASNSDGTVSLYFGYMNRNYEEEVDIPVGPDNKLEPGPIDQGQPAHFLPRRQKLIFGVKVSPKEFGEKQLTWTLTFRGKTEKVAGSLRPDYQIDKDRAPTDGNTPPVVTGTENETMTLPAAVTLSLRVTDDGLPKREQREQPRTDRPVPVGPLDSLDLNLHTTLGVTWSKYRGPGAVSFDPVRQPVVDGGVTTRATFSAPGEYMILAVAYDGSSLMDHCCWTNHLIQVTVKPPSQAGGR